MIDLDKALAALMLLGARVEHLLDLILVEMKDQSARLAKLEQANKHRNEAEQLWSEQAKIWTESQN